MGCSPQRSSAFGRTESAYDHFMKNEHDVIYEEIGQKTTLYSIEVALTQVDAEGVAFLFENREIEYEPGWTVTKA